MDNIQNGETTVKINLSNDEPVRLDVAVGGKHFSFDVVTHLIDSEDVELIVASSLNDLNGRIGVYDSYWNAGEGYTQQNNTLVDMLNDTYEKLPEIMDSKYTRKPVVLYETDGTSGLLGVNAGTLGENWQLTGYDFTPYSYLKCFIKASDYSTTSNYLTPSLVIELPLDDASRSKSVNDTITSGKVPCNMYLAGGSATNPNDRNVSLNAIVAVDTTKTKFQVVSVHSIYGTAQGDRNNNGRYLYKIEGHF